MISQSLPLVRGLLLIPTQLIGGIVAAALVSAMFPGAPSFTTTLTPGTSIARGLFIEMFLTAELEITILFLAAEKQKATFVAPVAIGLALFVAELAGEIPPNPPWHYLKLNHFISRCGLYRRIPKPRSLFRPLCRDP